jgi:uncharacterized protein
MQGPLEEAWQSMPVVVLEGLRVTGKTTLARAFVGDDRFVSLADEQTLKRALADPTGWLEALPLGVAVDEAQLVPGLTLAAKGVVDRRGGRPGQFLLTGSSRISRSELGGSDPLAGRARRLRLGPFTQCELAGSPRDVITALFDTDPRLWNTEASRHTDLVRRFGAGGLPGIRRFEPRSRAAGLAEYVEALFAYRTGRDTGAVVRLFHHLAATSGHLEFGSRIAAKLEISQPTVRTYLAMLADVFLVEPVDAYRPDPAKRITDRRRLFVADPAFVADALSVRDDAGLFDSDHGPFLETLTATELTRLAGWSSSRVRIAHWRRAEKDEVDLVVERADGQVVAIEVKAARSLQARAGNGIEQFRNAYPDKFHRGFVFHAGDHVEPLGDNVWAVPYSVLWTIGDATQVSLTERLGQAVEVIRTARQRPEASDVDQTRAFELLRRASADLATIGQTLRSLGFNTTEHHPTGMPLARGGTGPQALAAGWTRRPPGVEWTAKTGLDFGTTEKECTVRVTADLTGHTIEWNLTCDGAYKNDFNSPFVTGTEPVAYVAIADRLKLLVDRLPTIVERLA